LLYPNSNNLFNMERISDNVSCPKCGNQFSVEQAITSEIRKVMQAEFDIKQHAAYESINKKKEEADQYLARATKWKQEQQEIINAQLAKQRETIEKDAFAKAQADASLKMQLLQTQVETGQQQLNELKQAELVFLQKQKSFDEKMAMVEIELEQKILLRETELKKQAESMAEKRMEVALQQKQAELQRKTEEIEIEIALKVANEAEQIRNTERMRTAELQKQMDDTKKLMDEMQKRAEQGSMQMQGEVQELALEALLKNTFTFDRIDEVGKGMKGADCIQSVINNTGQQCGLIVYESKRTKTFSNEWILKLKEDMRLAKADIAVIVTEALPKELQRFGQLEGIWICTFTEVKSLAYVLRDSLIRIYEATQSQENKGEKMSMLYDYLTGIEFKNRIEGIVESFHLLEQDLQKEKKAMTLLWEKRSKQIERVMQNTISMYGSVKGIAGGAIKEVNGLNMDDENLLTP
jgi:hypothetical protein